MCTEIVNIATGNVWGSLDKNLYLFEPLNMFFSTCNLYSIDATRVEHTHLFSRLV